MYLLLLLLVQSESAAAVAPLSVFVAETWLTTVAYKLSRDLLMNVGESFQYCKQKRYIKFNV
jgi:hypothetical protein